MKFLARHKPSIISVAAVLAWLAISLWAPSSALKAGLSGIFLMTVPGYLLLKLFSRDNWLGRFWDTLSYSVGLSLIFLMLSGLAASLLLPLVGIAQPLTTTPLAGLITGELLAVMAILGAKGQALLPKPRLPRLTGLEWLFVGVGVSIPVLGILGAISLNNGGTSAFTLAMLTLICVYALALVWPKGRQLQPLHSFALYMSSLGMLFATSLRGWHITGHDIIQEYQVFELTATHGIWSMKFLQDAYNACLSITILPTILAHLTGLSDPYVYKIFFQLMFALVPVVLYLTISRYAPKRLAFLSAFVFVSFPTFMVDMPMLNRQEAAFLCFTLAFLTLFDNRLRRAPKSALVLLLFLGMILSHYSTSYVALAIIVIAKTLEQGLSWWAKLRRQEPAKRHTWMPLSWTATFILVLTAYLWNSQITNTGQGIASTITGITKSLPALVHPTDKTGESAYSLVGAGASDDQLFAQYKATTVLTRDLPAADYYPASLTNQYPPVRAQETVEPLTKFGQFIQNLHVPVYDVIDNLKLWYAKILQILIVFGLLVLAVRPQLARVPRQYLLVGISFLAMIALQVLLPSGIINYGLLRLLQQGLLFLALPVVLASYTLAGWIRVPERHRLRLIAVAFALFFAVLSGLIPTLTGGYKQALQTSNTGFYYEAYYTHDAELDGFAWLDQNAPKGAVVDTDEFARRKMITYADIYARSAMTPDTIAQDAYVYLSYADVTTNKLPVYISGTLMYELPPTAFLGNTKDIVYTNGNVRIYK